MKVYSVLQDNRLASKSDLAQKEFSLNFIVWKERVLNTFCHHNFITPLFSPITDK